MVMVRPRRKRKKSGGLIILCIIAGVFSSIMVLYLCKNAIASGFLGDSWSRVCEAVSSIEREKEIPPDNNKSQKNTPSINTGITPGAVVLTISAAGDCTLGDEGGAARSGSFGDIYNRSNKNKNYFFANVADIFHADDLTIVNLEGPLTNADAVRKKGPDITITTPTAVSENEIVDNSTPLISETAENKPKPKSYYWFKGKPEYSLILALGGVDAANIANNHTLDYGENGRRDTRQALDGAGILSFGGDDKAVLEIKGKKVVMLGYNNPALYMKKNIKNAIAAARSDGSDLVIVSFHWGDERSTKPNPLQKELGHYTIDAGADLVLGHHPHVIQPVEQYKGKYIVYSLANFCFGGNLNPSDKDTFIFQNKFVFYPDGSQEISSNIIPCRISSVSDRNNFQPTPLTGNEYERVLRRVTGN